MRALTATRMLYGSMLLLVPGKVLHALPHKRIDRRAKTFARILGARHLLQLCLVDREATTRRLRAGAIVDASHAATMIALAALRPERRQLASANALVAATFATAGILATRRPARCQ